MEGWDNALATTLDNFSNEKLYINPDFILKGLGMKRSDADEYLLSLIDELNSKSCSIAEPQSAFIIHDSICFDKVNHQIAIDEIILDTGKIVTNSLKKSSSLILFTATIGEKMEHFSKQLMKEGHALEGLIVDLIGSALVEAVVDQLHRHIEQTASSLGFNVSNRYSPGYCNWPVSDQQKLFPLLKGNDCGIILTESSLMLPVKSVSGVIGIGAELKKATYKCSVCSDVNCIMRLRKEEKEF